MTFEQIINEATLVADARTKTAKDFKKHCIEVAIPQILKAHKALGYSHLFIYHDTRLFTGVSEACNAYECDRFSTRFTRNGETFTAANANDVSFYDGVRYTDYQAVELDKLTFYGLLDCLPRMLAKLQKNTKEVQEKLERANQLMNV
jgi:hypothetical protein